MSNTRAPPCDASRHSSAGATLTPPLPSRETARPTARPDGRLISCVGTQSAESCERPLPYSAAVLRHHLLLACAAAAILAVAPASAQAAAPKKQLYVSLGDSYASGAQPTVFGQDRNTRNGFAYQVPALAAARGYRLQLVNFGCGGATTVSLIGTKGCAPLALGPGGRGYPDQTQLAAAESFLRKHRRQTALVTVSISGNDVTKCAREPDPVGCVTTAVGTINKNVTKIAKGLRKAAGKRVRIVGTTYPDVILGAWVNDDAASQNLATLSVVAFKSLINPALKKAYASANAGFVDVTAASGAYTPFEQTTTLKPYGTVPVAVAQVCELTYFCAFGDIHARTDGYHLIADLVAKQLPRRH
jgi:lysophospholipase L1-like esterase